MKFSAALRAVAPLVADRQFRRPEGHGSDVEAQLDRFLESVAVLDYQTDFYPGAELPLVTNDSRKVVPGALFVAVKGALADGRRFIPAAVEAGAAVVISRDYADDPAPGVLYLVVRDDYLAYAKLCEAFYDFPARKLLSFAVTGTNGKTTTAMAIRHLLDHAGKSCGLISTVEYDTVNSVEAADRTTPEAGRLFRLIAAMRDAGAAAFAMEASSHALAQNRLGGLAFQAAIFTNLTGDHLDYHHTMEEYFAAKRRLFEHHLAPDGVAVIHCGDPYGAELCKIPPAERVVSFGETAGQWRLRVEATDASGSSFTLTDGTREEHFHTNLVGRYNAANLAGAVLALDAAKVLPLADSARLLREHPLRVPGRLEAFALPSGATAFVDYAHTDDALRNVLTALRALTTGRVFTVFGAGGDRDKSKRPRMGRAAAEYSDELYLTSDNPRSEDPDEIIAMIASGIPADRPVHRIPEREAAIRAALEAAQSGDLVLIAGKGHEDYQESAGKKRHCDDRETVRDWIAGETTPAR